MNVLLTRAQLFQGPQSLSTVGKWQHVATARLMVWQDCPPHPSKYRQCVEKMFTMTLSSHDPWVFPPLETEPINQD